MATPYQGPISRGNSRSGKYAGQHVARLSPQSTSGCRGQTPEMIGSPAPQTTSRIWVSDASHSRPRVSNRTNQFSDAQFLTLKYQDESILSGSGSLRHARAVSRDLFDVVQRCAPVQRAHLSVAGSRPLRPLPRQSSRCGTARAWPRTPPIPSDSCRAAPSTKHCLRAVWINRPPKSTREDAPRATIVTPDYPQHGVIRRSQSISGDRSITLVTFVESLQ